MMKKMVPAGDEEFARERTDLLRQKHFDEIQRELDPSISNSDPNAQQTLSTMAQMFPAEEPKSVKVVDLKYVWNQDSSTHTLTLEYEFVDRWLLVNISIKRANGLPATISAFNVAPTADSLENINRFGLVGKSGPQYLMLCLAIAGPIFCIYTLVVCLRSKNQKLKWLWAIFILFGVGQLAVNWTTGELGFRLLAVHIPCASVTAVPAYGPWIVTVSLPLGALLFIARRNANAVPNQSQLPQTKYTPTTSPVASETPSHDTATKSS
jgi:hypothetical protein